MYFKDLLCDPSQLPAYEKRCEELSTFVMDCVRLLGDGFDATRGAVAASTCYSHSTVLMLARHIMASIDGVAVVVAQGCSENSGPLLRSAFEAHLGLRHVLSSKDGRRRALAYQVAHIHRRIATYRRLDATNEAGIALRKELAGNELVDLLDHPAADLQHRIATLEKCFSDPAFVPIEAAWQEARRPRKHSNRRNTPEWFSLFGGPSDLRRLAIQHKLGAIYEVLYRQWSESVHATGGMDNIGPSEDEGMNSVRPLRHPSGLETACLFAANFAIGSAHKLVSVYATDRLQVFAEKFFTHLSERYDRVANGGRIQCPWRGGT